MKTLPAQFIEQIHCGELRKRFWSFNRRKPFKGWAEYRVRTFRRLTIKDVPALLITGYCGMVLAGLLYQCSFGLDVGRMYLMVVVLAFVVVNARFLHKDNTQRH